MKKNMFCILIALFALIFAASAPAMASDYGPGFINGPGGTFGGYIQAQGGIDLYLENAAFTAGPIAGSADIVYAQASGQVQVMGAYAPSVEAYEYHQNYDYYYSYYNNYDQWHNYVEPTSMNIAASQVYEKVTQLTTGYGLLIMAERAIQTGSINIEVAQPTYQTCE